MSKDSFNNLTYKGQLLIRDEDNGIAIAYYEHIYRTNFQEMTHPGTGYRRHACLWQGAWCWKNVREYPLDIISFVKYKLRRMK